MEFFEGGAKVVVLLVQLPVKPW